jgi:hypothetical protein
MKKLEFLHVLEQIAPVIMALVPGAQPFIPLAVSGMMIAEQAGVPGADKFQIMKQAVSVGAKTANLAAKREVINENDAVNFATSVASDVIAATKLIHTNVNAAIDTTTPTAQ